MTVCTAQVLSGRLRAAQRCRCRPAAGGGRLRKTTQNVKVYFDNIKEKKGSVQLGLD